MRHIAATRAVSYRRKRLTGTVREVRCLSCEVTREAKRSALAGSKSR
jgi:hypothetical protein